MGGRDQFDTNIIIKQHKAVVTRENICHAENVIFPGIMMIVFKFTHCVNIIYDEDILKYIHVI